MYRWVAPIALMILFPVASGAGAAGTDPPFHSPEPVRSAKSFTIPDSPPTAHTRPSHGSRILAGTKLMPNGTIGLGFFGYREAKDPLNAMTAREMARPKSRKMSVGFSLRF